jgi:hypothetical protein
MKLKQLFENSAHSDVSHMTEQQIADLLEKYFTSRYSLFGDNRGKKAEIGIYKNQIEIFGDLKSLPGIDVKAMPVKIHQFSGELIIQGIEQLDTLPSRVTILKIYESPIKDLTGMTDTTVISIGLKHCPNLTSLKGLKLSNDASNRYIHISDCPQLDISPFDYQNTHLMVSGPVPRNLKLTRAILIKPEILDDMISSYHDPELYEIIRPYRGAGMSNIFKLVRKLRDPKFEGRFEGHVEYPR